MGLFRREKAKRKSKKKVLLVQISEDINELVSKFTDAANIPQQELGYALGRLCSTPEMEEHLSFIMQLYFLTGIYYREEIEDDEFSYEYVTEKQKDKAIKEAKDQMEQLIADLTEAKTHSDGQANYIG